MSEQRLFSVNKVPIFCDSYTPGIEKRRGEQVSIVTLTLRVQPFDAKLATAIDDGLGDNGVRSQLFKLSTAEMRPHIDRVNFSLDCPRQQLQVFASTDTEDASIAFDQVKISGAYARTSKDVDGYAFVVRASFGPVGPAELAYIHTWYATQRAVSFLEAEPSLDFEDEASEGETGDEAPSLEFAGAHINWPRVAANVDKVLSQDGARPRRPRATHARKAKTRRHDPEAERARQAKAGKRKTAKKGRRA